MWKMTPTPFAYWAQIPCLSKPILHELKSRSLSWPWEITTEPHEFYYHEMGFEESTVLDLVSQKIKQLNTMFFNYDIDAIEKMYAIKLKSPNCAITYDADIIYQTRNSRKFTFIIPLNDNFDGGPSTVKIGKKEHEIEKTPGLMTLIPSFVTSAHLSPDDVSDSKMLLIGSVVGPPFK